MDNKNAPKEPKEKRSAVEKPISLRGASFTEVLGALLKTKPMPKENGVKKTAQKEG
ncbi:MAG: hypothetical protein Q7U34_10050 [Anaerolineales bacterium]|nr:hypothetical protein [Anaerolineales bacterium]